MIREILDAKDKRLRGKSKTVAVIDKKVQTLIKDLKDTLVVQNDPDGIGLAAPQIGKNIMIFVMKPGKEIKTVINPEVVFISKKKEQAQDDQKKNIMEGCLSLPHFYGNIKRSQKIKIKFLDEKGQAHIQTFNGLDAQIVQHEIDHLNGRLFIDELIKQKKPLFEYKNGEWEEVEL
ncbi:peptide deformylase [Candidatus Woesebacteria bacterium RIFCSPHIGHO2_01_FULL_38_9b]|uniref:Peptide deformylase n=1 Tax=Candidatus Woesebacteria bacterium RIFCSPHIGHO2_01_FULL_38_9b TaxID=1802493 RepID=A0A1F7Y6I1_9BACT|nr:MAG: peptide deformylase [Candidatus Woesebacteria bacterium RIFCSPHIGHO2_01_FULL_38_9b]